MYELSYACSKVQWTLAHPTLSIQLNSVVVEPQLSDVTENRKPLINQLNTF